MYEHALRKDLNVIVTHVGDSSWGREEQYVYLSGKHVKSNTWIPMDECIENIRNILENRPLPLHQNLQVGQICCVLINEQWHRACVTQLELDPDQKLQVQLVDSGASYCASLASLRTLEGVDKMRTRTVDRGPTKMWTFARGLDIFFGPHWSFFGHF